jgi:hypothetical protein
MVHGDDEDHYLYGDAVVWCYGDDATVKSVRWVEDF